MPDSNLTFRTSHFSQGSGSCRGTNGTNYFIAISPSTPIEFVKFRVVWDTRQNRIFTVRGLTTGAPLNFTRTSNTLVLGADGRNWRRQHYEFESTGNSDLELSQIEFSLNRNFFIDRIRVFGITATGEEHYIRIKGTNAFNVTVNLNDTIAGTNFNVNLPIRSRFENLDTMTMSFLALDVDAPFYVECLSVSLTGITSSNHDPTPQFSASCSSPVLNQVKSPFFTITNNSGGDFIFPLDMTVQLQYRFHLKEDASSTSFTEFQQLIGDF